MSVAESQGEPWRVGGLLVQARLFVVSYAPLLAIFAVESRSRRMMIGFAVAAAVAFIAGLRLVAASRARTARQADLSDIDDRSTQIAGYLATYLLPFISGPPTNWRHSAAYGLYFGVAFLVSMKSDGGLINPTLYLFGYRVVEATLRGRRVLLICPGSAIAPGRHRVFQMMGGAGYVLAEQGSKKPTT
jgi:hypothetical protein